jgi:hypothetical protein
VENPRKMSIAAPCCHWSVELLPAGSRLT